MISKALDQLSAASGQLQQQQQQQQQQAAAAAQQAQIGEDGAAGDEEGTGTPALPKKPLWTGVNGNKSAKSQALEAMKALIAWQPIPVMRARMKLRVTCPVPLLKQSVKSAAPAGASKETEAPSGGGAKNNKKGGKGKGKGKSARRDESDSEGDDAPLPAKGPSNVKDKILSFIESVESQEVAGSDEWEVVGFAEPGAFKSLNEFIGNETRGRGRVEVLDMAVTHED
ncbi:ribosome maturation protein [Aspergillus spectabilis]